MPAPSPIDLPTRCRCGHVAGTVLDVSPRTVNHAICYCRDCRAYARWLGKLELLDSAGGSDIVQAALGRVRFSEGLDALACMRLSPKGMHRWYADCCRTPVGNTMLGLPFIGLAASFLDPARPRPLEASCGPAVAIQEQSATGPVPGGVHRLAQVRSIAHAARLFATWMVTGAARPTPLFDDAIRTPRVTPRVLSREERDALRDPA